MDDAIRAVLFAITSLEEAARCADGAKQLIDAAAEAAHEPTERAQLAGNAVALMRCAERARSRARTARSRLQHLGAGRTGADTVLRSVVWDTRQD